MVRLRPEDTTKLIPISFEVLEHSTSRNTVTMVYEFGLTVNLLPTHLSGISFSLSISSENLSLYNIFEFYRHDQEKRVDK
ncbi:hypothetical protein YC2023_087346 [Brassica napus]